MRNHPRPYGGYDHPAVHWLIMLAILAGLVALVVWAVLRLTRHQHTAPAPSGALPRTGPDPALEHARVRYARGELSRDDYLRVVADLGGTPPAPEAPPGPAAPTA